MSAFGCQRSNPAVGTRSQALSNGVDFTVTSVGGPTSVVPGGGFSVPVTVCNIGNVAAPTDVAVILSTDNLIAAPPDTILNDLSLGTLGPGQCVYPVLHVTATVPNGAYYLGAIANNQNQSMDVNPGNNALAGNTIGIGNGPDLVVSAVSGPTSALGMFPGTVTVCNQGNASASTNVDLFLSTDATITSSDYNVGTFPVGMLNPGQCVTQNVNFSSNVPPGAYYLGAIADNQNQVVELIETNNAQAGNQIGIGSGPDFVVSAVSGPPSAQGMFPGTVTVCNQGNVSASTNVDLFLSTDAVITPSDYNVGSFPIGMLNPGQCVTQNVSFNSPVPMGVYYLGAIADNQNQVVELIETNNAQAGGQIGIGSGPDLIVSSVSGPGIVQGGSSISASVTVCNQGTAPTGGTPVEVRLSTDTIIDSSDFFVGSSFVSSLPPGACSTVPVQGPASVPDGAYYLGAIVDPGNSVMELIETNNTNPGSLIGVGFRPDFVVSAVSGPTAASPGSGFNVSVTVCNQGTSYGSTPVDLFLSSDANITLADQPIFSLPPMGLNPNQCMTQSVWVSPSVPPGAYYLGAIADSQNQVVELIETNNALAGNAIGVGNGPDFIVSAVSGPTAVAGGGAFNVSVTVCNQGNAPGSPNVDVLLSSTTALSSIVPPQGGTSVGTLNPGQCSTLTIPANASVPNGTYYLGAFVDRQNQFTELIETNNTLIGNQVGVGFAPDLVVSSVTGPVSALGGANFTAQIVVCNQGTTSSPGASVDLKLSSSATIATGAFTAGNAPVPGLAVGQCTPVSVSGFANVPQGPWYLGAIVDSQNQVVELFENNNATAGAQMGVGSAPDFTVSAVSGPASAQGGAGFNVSLTVCNQGTTSGSTSVDVYLSTSATITTAANHAGGVPSVGPLSPGQCSPVTVPASATVPQGAYYVGAIVNAQNQAVELNPNNDSQAGNQIGIGNGPDLVVSGVSGPVSVQGGASFNAQVNVCNQGTASSPGAYVDVLLSSSATITPSSSTYVSSTPVPGLSPGQCWSQPVSSYANVPPGAWFLGATVDRNNQVMELIETNNTSAGNEIGVGYGPDYYVSSVTYPSAILPGGSATAQVSYCNQGTASGPGVNLDLYQSTTQSVTTASQHIGNLFAAGLNPGQCATVPVNIVVNGPVGTYYLGVIVDAQNQVSELLKDNNTRVGSSILVTNNPPPPCVVDPARELMIRDPLVVEDPTRTTGLGAWTFGKLMTDMAGGSQNVSNFVLNWLNTWSSNQVVNGFTISARPNIQTTVIGPWQAASGGPVNPLDMTKAPFRLLAIVNRIDLRNLPSNAGEGRFVFGVLDGAGNPLQFTVILEYKLPGTTAADVANWANLWHALGQTPISDPTFNGKLQAITDKFAGANMAPGNPNGSAIGQVRTNEIALGPVWQLREFTLGSNGQLQPATVKQTPDINGFNNSPTLANFINQNSAAILAGTFTVPATFNGLNFLGGSGDVQSPSVFWNAPGIQNNDARQQFSLNACNGCHAGETGTQFLQISPRSSGQAAQLSGFLTGITLPDPVSGVLRSFNDLQRRSTDLQSLVCAPGSYSAMSGSATIQQSSTVSGSATMQQSTSLKRGPRGVPGPFAHSPTLPRSRVH